jgi:predicted DNA-binding protein (MmcQ/YjbR family)
MNIEEYRDYCLSLGADVDNLPSKYWIGVDANVAEDALLRDLTRNSYEIVKAKYTKKTTINR